MSYPLEIKSATATVEVPAGRSARLTLLVRNTSSEIHRGHVGVEIASTGGDAKGTLAVEDVSQSQRFFKPGQETKVKIDVTAPPEGVGNTVVLRAQVWAADLETLLGVSSDLRCTIVASPRGFVPRLNPWLWATIPAVAILVALFVSGKLPAILRKVPRVKMPSVIGLDLARASNALGRDLKLALTNATGPAQRGLGEFVVRTTPNAGVLIPTGHTATFYLDDRAAPIGLVHYWKGENNLRDEVGRLHGDQAGSSVVFESEGKVGAAFRANGAVKSGIRYPSADPNLWPERGFAVHVWIWPEHRKEQRWILASLDNPTTPRFKLGLQNGKPRVEFDGISGDFPVPPLKTNDWFALGLSYSNGVIWSYVDGSTYGAIPNRRSRPGPAPVSIAPIPMTGNPFLGRIDETTIFNRALSKEEMHRLFEAGMRRFYLRANETR